MVRNYYFLLSAGQNIQAQRAEIHTKRVLKRQDSWSSFKIDDYLVTFGAILANLNIVIQGQILTQRRSFESLLGPGTIHKQ